MSQSSGLCSQKYCLLAVVNKFSIFDACYRLDEYGTCNDLEEENYKTDVDNDDNDDDDDDDDNDNDYDNCA
jgi:hypothetical protein